MKLVPDVDDGTRILKVQFPSFENLRGAHTRRFLSAERVFSRNKLFCDFSFETYTISTSWDKDVNSPIPKFSKLEGLTHQLFF